MADTKAGIYSPSDARIVLDAVRRLLNSGLLNSAQPTDPVFTSAEPIIFRNDSGSTVPAFGTMKITGAVEYGGKNVITIEQPDTDENRHLLFNTFKAVDNGEYGVGSAGPIVRVVSSDSPTIAESMQSTGSDWEVEVGPGGPLVCIGGDDIGTNVFRAVVRSVTRSSWYKAPAGGIAAKVGTTLGSATCTRYKLVAGVETATSETATVYNGGSTAVANNAFVFAVEDTEGFVTAVWEDC